ncbi:Beta-lactamase-like protein 2 [Apophysomyces sp. BC1034]|nr:Beta-lactamase-like protein 2 [Apophysomyces sp. BC1015]KAG0177709.1 Beta-lactamase-like protein 2 [Apophysomyces sp. BC1021]KAG0188044.1 Beta-lactamase-like protein 2 [Apophysomyces sp. BC1034]
MSNKLPTLPNFTRLSERVWRVLGLNPGLWTLQGTNTYLVGLGPQKILIDCGEGEPAYLPLLLQSLQQISPDAYISDIIITHCHVDHWRGLKDILPVFENARVHKYPLPPGCNDEEHHMLGFPIIQVHPLHDNQLFKLPDTTLRVIHTPGHAKDHCSFWLEEESVLFTADCVLGHGSAVFDDLHEYMMTLRKLISLNPIRLYPGHGPVVEEGAARVKQYIRQREQHEQQIINLMLQDRQKHWTVLEIVENLYENLDNIKHALILRQVGLHMLKLEKDGRAKMIDGPFNYDETNIFEMIDKSWCYIAAHL